MATESNPAEWLDQYRVAVRLSPGRYTARTPLTVYLLRGSTEIEYTVLDEGQSFDVPRSANGYHYSVVSYPEYGDAAPSWYAGDYCPALHAPIHVVD